MRVNELLEITYNTIYYIRLECVIEPTQKQEI